MLLVSESPLALPESANTSVFDQKHFFSLNFFFQESSCHGIFDFLFEIRALESFCLSALLECYSCVLAESRVVRIILLLFVSLYFQKIQKHLLIIMHCILHFAQYLHQIQICFGVIVRTSYREICIQHLKKKLCITRSMHTLFSWTPAFAWIVRFAFYFLLRHNTISCMTISYF